MSRTTEFVSKTHSRRDRRKREVTPPPEIVIVETPIQLEPFEKFWPVAHRMEGRYQFRVIEGIDLLGKPLVLGEDESPHSLGWKLRRIYVEHMPHPLLDGTQTTIKQDEREKNQLKLQLRDFWAGDFSIKPDTSGHVARFSILQDSRFNIRDVLRIHGFSEEKRVASMFGDELKK
jgi:hypothetical protein